MLQQTYTSLPFPSVVDFQTPAVLKALNKASRALAEFKGLEKIIPNQEILINTLSLQEAQASSAIENIVITQDETFQIDILQDTASPNIREVARCRHALRYGFEQMQNADGIISNNLLIELFEILKQQQGAFRKTPGTVLRNGRTGETVYVPPQHHDEIVKLMTELETIINDDDAYEVDPLIKMAIIHHQFESIHPFSDGNGRIGRILNLLYLTKTGLLGLPILYFSHEIMRRRPTYYKLLQEARDHNTWGEWVIYMLHCVEINALEGVQLLRKMSDLMADFKVRMRGDLPQLYSHDLLNNLFRHPYTCIEFIKQDLDVTRQTASRYLTQLAEHGFVHEHKVGRNKYYINDELVKLFTGPQRMTDSCLHHPTPD